MRGEGEGGRRRKEAAHAPPARTKSSHLRGRRQLACHRLLSLHRRAQSRHICAPRSPSNFLSLHCHPSTRYHSGRWWPHAPPALTVGVPDAVPCARPPQLSRISYCLHLQLRFEALTFQHQPAPSAPTPSAVLGPAQSGLLLPEAGCQINVVTPKRV